MQSRRRLNSATGLFIRTAILIFVPILLYVSIVNWRYMWAYREIKANHTETVETNCVSVALDRTDEPNGHIPYRQIYNFVLGDGTNVSIYKDIVDEIFPSREALEQQLVTGRTMVFTYIPKPLFTNGAFVLLSVSDDGKVIIDKAGVVHAYYGRLKTGAIILLIFSCIALLILLMPPTFYLYRKHKRRRKKRLKRKSKMRKNLKQQ